MAIKKTEQITLTDKYGCELTVTALADDNIAIKAYDQGDDRGMVKSQTVNLKISRIEAEQLGNEFLRLSRGGG